MSLTGFCAVLAIVLAIVAHATSTVKINIKDLVFSSSQVSLRVGDVIEWVNSDFIDHTATADNNDFDVVIPAGTATHLVIEHSGTINYYCRYHPGMKGQFEVRAPRY
jgi:plastocyanin